MDLRKWLPKIQTAMNSTEWRALSEEVGAGTDYGENTDWFKQIEQTALSTDTQYFSFRRIRKNYIQGVG